jgi:hypothetical protein
MRVLLLSRAKDVMNAELCRARDSGTYERKVPKSGEKQEEGFACSVPLEDESKTGDGSGHTGEGLLGSTGGHNGDLRLGASAGGLRGLGLGRSLGLSRSLGSLRLSRSLGLAGSDGLAGGDGLGGSLRLRDDNNRRLAGGDRLGGGNGLGRLDGRVDGLALALGALLVGVAVVLALIEVPSVLIDVADELASVVDRVVLVTLALVAVADDALVALITLVVGIVALSAVADLELAPGVVVAFTRSAEAVLADDLPLGAGRAVDLRSTVVTVADDDDIGGDGGENSGDGLGDGGAVLSEGDGGSGGDRREGLGDEVGVDDSVSLTGVHTDGDVDGEENVDSDLSAHEAVARRETTTVLSIIARASDVTLVSADRRRGAEVKLVTTVAAVVVETEEVGAQAGIGTTLRVVLLRGVGLSEAREAILRREASEEVEAVRVANAASRCAGSGTGGLSASDIGASGGSTSLHGCGGVGEAASGELGSGQVAHGQGEELGVTHFCDGGSLERMTWLCNDWKTTLGREARGSRVFELLDDESRKEVELWTESSPLFIRDLGPLAMGLRLYGILLGPQTKPRADSLFCLVLDECIEPPDANKSRVAAL